LSNPETGTIPEAGAIAYYYLSDLLLYTLFAIPSRGEKRLEIKQKNKEK
jgi:hypothetical protein